MMAFTEIWGCGGGGVSRLPPAARVGLSLPVLCASLLLPLNEAWGLALTVGMVSVWTVACGLPVRRLAAVLAFAGCLFLPWMALAFASGWQGVAGAETWRIFAALGVRGMACAVVGASTMAALGLAELGQALSGLPLPRAVVSLVVQIAHQTALMADESRRVAVALRVRGVASATWLCRLRVLVSFPVLWLLRLVGRAERVGDAMEIRGLGREASARETLASPASCDALVMENVTVRYRSEAPEALSGVSLRIARGERVALMGLNGAGKTTVLHAIAGLVPFTGRIEADGVPLVPGNAGRVRDRLGFVFGVPDDQILFPRVVDDVAFSLERRGIPAEEARRRAGAVMQDLGISALADSSPHRLSQGQRQRVALAGALVPRPPLLLLDEPSASLDPVGQEELVALLERLDAALLLVTHDLTFARRICQRFVLLHAGRVVGDRLQADSFQMCEQYWDQAVLRVRRTHSKSF